MQKIDESRLEADPQYRYEYLAEFIEFGPDDVRAIQQCAPLIGPRISELVERTYDKLLSFEATARHFVPRQNGYAGDPPVDLSSLDASHPQIAFRKDHLNRYFMSLIGRSYDARMVQYLDMVGRIHTSAAGNQQIEVPLIQMNALMGLISDILTQTLLEAPLDHSVRSAAIRAFNKLLWIQNDFIGRHYQRPANDG